MSIRIMSLVWDEGPPKINHRMVLLALADFANDEGWCWPSIATLCRKTTLSERAVQGCIRDLEAQGWVKTVHGGGTKSNQYTITPAQRAPVQDMPPRTACPAPPQDMPRTPAQRAPKPSVTIIEPSEDNTASGNIPEKPPPLSRLPSNWTLSDAGWAYARKHNIPDEVIEDEARGFHVYWTDRRGRDAAKSEHGWEQCWANRVRTICARYQPRGGMAGQTKASGHGQRSSLASIAARRWSEGSV